MNAAVNSINVKFSFISIRPVVSPQKQKLLLQLHLHFSIHPQPNNNLNLIKKRFLGNWNISQYTMFWLTLKLVVSINNPGFLSSIKAIWQ